MAIDDAPRPQPRPLRVQVEAGRDGAYLWAPFGEHMKAGLASLAPILLLNLVAAAGLQAGDPGVAERITNAINVTGEFLVTWGWVGLFFGGAYCALWGWMSYRLVRALRYRPSVYAHLAAHAAAGAVGLLAACMGILFLVQSGRGESIAEADTFGLLLVGAPALGAAGSLVGMWVLKRALRWYVSQVRPPLPDITFVDRRNVRDHYERM